MNKEIEIAKNKGFSKKEIEEISIVSEIKSGNKEKFAVIMDKYYKITLGKMIRFTEGDTMKAEDLTSDVMVKALENINKFNVSKGNGKFHSWINRLAYTTFIDDYRKNKSRTTGNSKSIDEVMEYGDSKIHGMQIADENLNVVNEISKVEDTEKLMLAINKLSDKEKKIIELKYFANMQFDEIAEELKMNVSTCRVTSRRAIKKLKDLLE